MPASIRRNTNAVYHFQRIGFLDNFYTANRKKKIGSVLSYSLFQHAVVTTPSYTERNPSWSPFQPYRFTYFETKFGSSETFHFVFEIIRFPFLPINVDGAPYPSNFMCKYLPGIHHKTVSIFFNFCPVCPNTLFAGKKLWPRKGTLIID